MYEVKQRYQQAWDNLQTMKKNEIMYKTIQVERKRFLTIQYMHKNPTDVDQMVDMLYTHFKIIQITCFEDRAKENYLGLGTEELIAESNKELMKLEKDLKNFRVEKDDLRYDLYKMITEMLFDNIALRMWVNDLMSH